MTPDRKLNPEVVKEAAEKAEQVNCNGEKLDWRILEGVGVVNGRFVEEEFNPLTSDSDAWALERALKNRGWSFGPASFPSSGNYRATHKIFEVQYDDSDTLLLLKCVAAMHSLDLYVEGE